MNNWPISGADGVSCSAGPASAVTLIATSTRDIGATDVMIDNPGPLDIYVKAGPDSSVVATLHSVRVPANSLQPFAKGAGNDYLAGITASGTQAFTVHVGDGQ
jgi:hypothetical protein